MSRRHLRHPQVWLGGHHVAQLAVLSNLQGPLRGGRLPRTQLRTTPEDTEEAWEVLCGLFEQLRARDRTNLALVMFQSPLTQFTSV